MTDIQPQLLEQATDYVRDRFDIDGAQPDEIIGATLEFFTRAEEWQSLAIYGDDGSDCEDEHSKVYPTADDLLAEFGTVAFSPNRRLQHRFVLTTNWQEVRPDLEWKPA